MHPPELDVRLLGPLRASRSGTPAALPASRKVRALLAYLALAPRPLARAHLCELLWDAPDDPRGELRWCLSKLRKIVDGETPRLQSGKDTVWLERGGAFIDAVQVAAAVEAGLATLAAEELRALCALFEGDFLEGLEIERSPAFAGWLTAQRRRFRGCRAALLEHLAARVEGEEALACLEQWLAVAPFDRRAHEALLAALAGQGRVREAEEHLAAAVRHFEAEGLDPGPVVQAWRSARGVARALEAPPPLEPAAVPPRRASIAVMPFADRSAVPTRGGPADALAHDVITRLAKLRSLFVIAQGTVFALHERKLGAEDAGRLLDVDYVVGGSVGVRAGRLAASVELTETRSARVVWAELFNRPLDDAFLVLEEIGNRIVASVAAEIELIERNRAILRPPESLDAWGAHHRGLWHMYRFSRADNEEAQQLFTQALRLDPTFSRAYAGLSFTHFQGAFQGWAERAPQLEAAYRSAAQGLMVDDRDPAAHWAMGRALWLRGRHDESAAELEQAIALSPNFALAHYNLAFVHATLGDPQAALAPSDYSRDLSPFDPMLFAMLAVRALALTRLGRYEEALEWARRAAARPNAFPHIQVIAALAHALAGALDEARAYAAAVRRTAPGYRLEDFLAAFQFDAAEAARFREGARRIGLA